MTSTLEFARTFGWQNGLEVGVDRAGAGVWLMDGLLAVLVAGGVDDRWRGEVHDRDRVQCMVVDGALQASSKAGSWLDTDHGWQRQELLEWLRHVFPQRRHADGIVGIRTAR